MPGPGRAASPVRKGAVRVAIQVPGRTTRRGERFCWRRTGSSNAKKAAFSNIGQDNVSTLQAYQSSCILNCRKNNDDAVMGNEIICNDPTSGKKVWSRQLSGDIKKVSGFTGTPPVAAGGNIIVGTLSGKVLRLDPKSGKQIKEYDVKAPIRYQPVVQDGIIFVGTQDGRLVAIKTHDNGIDRMAHVGRRRRTHRAEERQGGAMRRSLMAAFPIVILLLSAPLPLQRTDRIPGGYLICSISPGLQLLSNHGSRGP